MTVLLDYGIGNLRSLETAFAAAGVPLVRTADADAVRRAERLVLPGVGAFGACADALRARGLDALVLARAREGVPVLGVCVGMQLLFEHGEEHGEHRGLGLLPGRVVRFADGMRGPDGERLKVPHMGWNAVRSLRPHPLADALAPPGGGDAHVYFVHSYLARPADPADVVAEAWHGEAVPAIVARGAVCGVQFHPEKSGAAGLRLLRAFAEIPTAARALAARGSVVSA